MTKENFISIIKELIFLNKTIINLDGTTVEEAMALDDQNIYLFSVVAALRENTFSFDEIDEGYEGFSYMGKEDFEDDFEDEYEDRFHVDDDYEDDYEDWEGNWPEDAFEDDEQRAEKQHETHYLEMIDEILGDLSAEIA